MDAFINKLRQHDLEHSESLSRGKMTTLQVNLGNLCNQSCVHCHIDASPDGKNIMPKEVINDILGFLSRHKMRALDITGGAPEMNPHFEYFVEKARGLVDELIVRSNLTVLTDDKYKHLPEFFKKYNVHLICSMPCYLQQNVDSQRGINVFKKSVLALKILNELGFAKQKGVLLDLVYNPVGANLPPSQEALEKDYKKILSSEHGVNFNRLITITNVPIKRFKNYLESKGEYVRYRTLLEDNFNPEIIGNIMCRTFLSVGFDGKLYDCDFNQALGLVLKDRKCECLTIKNLDPDSVEGNEIILGEHCLSCMAGNGSSCQGALTQEDQEFQVEIEKQETKESVKDYYGKILKSTKDLQTSACCTSDAMPDLHKEILKKIEPEILYRFYGCGSPLPDLLEGATVLDLGCGTGRDVYLASYLSGENGKVIGLDMTDEQLDVARSYQDIQAKNFGFNKSNVEFKKGYIEELNESGIKDSSVDVVISNCVINLSPDKKKVFAEIFRVLKEGGELLFSDVFADRRLPESIKNDPVFYGECLGGSLYIEDFRRILREVGCLDYRIVTSRKIALNNKDMEKIAENINFYSVTVRAFKLKRLEDICEDYGQVATYLGMLPDKPNKFVLDDHHEFITNKPMLVCGNTASMLSDTRYAPYFKIDGDRSRHFGAFDCKVEVSSEKGKTGCC